MYLIMGSCRIRWIGRENLAQLRAEQRNWIYSAWHNNTATSVWTERRRGIAMMASASADGELIARAIAALGNVPVRGSSSTEGSKAARVMIRALRSGRNAALTPDGPRGPKYVLQPGALWIAAMSGCPLVPYHIEATRQWEFNSWDAHKIPKPFSTVYVCIGTPYTVDKERLKRDTREMVDEFQQSMMANTRHCLALAERTAEE